MKKAVFIDRDGTIIKDKHYIFKATDVVFFPYTVDIIRLFNDNGFLVIVITNQSGIGRGLFTEEDVLSLHRYIQDELQKKNARIDAFYLCPHYVDFAQTQYNKQCSCRKPAPGLFLQAEQDYSIDLSQSYMIGDKLTDVLAGENAGLKRSFLITEDLSVEEIAKQIIDDSGHSNT